MRGRDAWDAMALVGHIARTHGIRGDVIVNPETDFVEERFRPGAALATWQNGAVAHVIIETVRVQQGRPVLHFRGIDSIDAAEELAGSELRIPRDALTPLEEGRYYRHELIGCRVEDASGTLIGTVQHVDSDVGNDRLVVGGARGEVLIPMAAEICIRIDPANGIIVVNPPEGLLELNESSSGRQRH